MINEAFQVWDENFSWESSSVSSNVSESTLR